MSSILTPSLGPDSWKQFLAKPELHWATGYSARTLAHSWEAANGLPPEIAALLQPALGDVEPLVIIPEHKTPLPGGRRESQSDVFFVGRHSGGLVACTVEGKVDEPFGPTVADQMKNASPGQQQRLRYLCERLGLGECPGEIRYQLLHRTVSALIEADRFAATHAAMVVHSFSPARRWFDDYSAFVSLLGGKAEIGCPTVIEGISTRLILGWACGDPIFRTR